MENINDFVQMALSLLRDQGAPEDVARVYVRKVLLHFMGVDGRTSTKLACWLEALAQENA